MQDTPRLTRGALGPHNLLTLASMQHLSDLYLRTEQPALALEQLEPVVTGRERPLDKAHGDVLAAKFMAASATLLEHALALLEPALDVRQRQMAPGDPDCWSRCGWPPMSIAGSRTLRPKPPIASGKTSTASLSCSSGSKPGWETAAGNCDH